MVTREECSKLPNSLPKLLSAVKWNDRDSVTLLYQLLCRWPVVAPETALQLLDCSFSDLRVRAYAVRCLDDGLKDEKLAQYLLQLVQVCVSACTGVCLRLYRCVSPLVQVCVFACAGVCLHLYRCVSPLVQVCVSICTGVCLCLCRCVCLLVQICPSLVCVSACCATLKLVLIYGYRHCLMSCRSGIGAIPILREVHDVCLSGRCHLYHPFVGVGKAFVWTVCEAGNQVLH